MPAQTLSAAILSGKGGVGKTSVTLNLALALQKSGASVLVIDGDLGLANVDVLMGFTARKTVWDVLQARATLAEAMHEDVSGVHVLPAASGTGQQAQLDLAACQKLLRVLRPVAEKHDFVLLDLGAGLSETVRLLARAAAVQLVVTTPEPTALTDAYALIKVLHTAHHLDRFYVAVNNIYQEEELALTRTRLLTACRKFIQLSPKLIGSIRHDPALQEAVLKRVPLLRLHPESPAAEDITLIAKKLKALRRKMNQEGLLNPCLTLRRPQAQPAPAAAAKPQTAAKAQTRAAAKTSPAKKASTASTGRTSAAKTAKKA